MLVPAWLIAYGVVFLVGVIVGLLARFLLALASVVVVLVLLGIAMLGAFDPSAIASLLGLLGRAFGDLPFAPATFFTFGALIFAGGVLAGVLLTTPLYGVERARPTS